MTTNLENRAGQPSFRRRVALALAGAACVIGLVAASSAHGDAGPQEDDISLLRLVARAEIEGLERCYAKATDTIGSGDTEGGRAIYKTCFTPNAQISASFPGADPNGPPDLSTIGPDAWTQIVEDTFAASGFESTQHIITNVRIDFDGNSATVESYLNATHVLDPEGSIDLANGTYTSTVVRTAQGWRIAKRDLRLITYMRVDSPVAP